MEFKDKVQFQNETASSDRKGPNLLKNMNIQNDPPAPDDLDPQSELNGGAEIPLTENKPMQNDNDSDCSEACNSSNNDSGASPDDENTPVPSDDFESYEDASSFNNNSDAVPDDNDIPSNSVDRENYQSFEDYSSSLPSDDGDSDSGVVADIDSEPPDDAAPLSSFDSTPDELEPYAPDKISSSSVMGGMKPLKLNRQMILFIILGFFCLSFFFVSFIIPSFKQKKAKEASQRKQLEQSSSADYSLYAHNDTPDANNDSYSKNIDYTDVDIPDPFERRQPEYQPVQQQTAPVSAGGVFERPDTRNDRLQGKSISGIKGVTPSRQNYSSSGPIPSSAVFSDSNNPYARFGMPPKDDYIKSVLSQYSNPQSGGGGYASQNNQGDKLNFMNQGRENSGGGQWLPVNSVWQGSIFEATLTSSINTDLPGECTAWITKNVYSSLDGQLLLIPQNSRLFGSYNSSISYSQSRVQIGWHTLIRPDGYAINLGNMNASDPQGASGLKGFVNDHPFAYLKALALITALSIANLQFNASMGDTDNQYVQNILADSQNITNRLAEKIIDRAIDIQPTIVIKSGTKINIVANQTLILPPLAPFGVTQPYHKGE